MTPMSVVIAICERELAFFACCDIGESRAPAEFDLGVFESVRDVTNAEQTC